MGAHRNQRHILLLGQGDYLLSGISHACVDFDLYSGLLKLIPDDIELPGCLLCLGFDLSPGLSPIDYMLEQYLSYPFSPLDESNRLFGRLR
jgi:hypothetical protein